jgi:hypothetical protein
MGLPTKHFLFFMFFRCKLTWTDMAVREPVKAHFTCEMGLLEENTTSTKADDGEDFFVFDVVESLLTQAYLSQPAAPLSSLTAFPAVRKLFVRTNTALPSNASVERLFSCAGLILTYNRARAGDGSFEAKVLLKMNDL